MWIGAEEKTAEIPYTYSVTFEQNNNILYENRLDYLLKSVDEIAIQRNSIFTSLGFVTFFISLFILLLLLCRHA